MKTLTRVFILLLILLVTEQSTFSQISFAVKERGNLAELPLRAVSIKRSNVPLALHDIVDKYGIPIGVEVSPDDDLHEDRKILVRFDNGTLKDALNSIVSQNPLYTWEIENDVVNVFPKGYREPLLKTLLETRIETLRIPPGMSRFTLRESLTKSPELKGVLASFGVEPNNEAFSSRDVATLGRSFSLELSTVTVKAILNRVIRDSEAKYWIINRDGPRRRYLLLNL